MKRGTHFIIIFIIALIFLSGCKQAVKSPEHQAPQFRDDPSLGEFIKKTEPNKTEQAPPEPEEPEPVKAKPKPFEGKIKFNSNVEKTIPVLEMTADIDMKTSGEIEYKVDKFGVIRGNGKGNLDVGLESDIGIAVCKGTKKIPITFTVTGIYDHDSGKAIFKSFDIKPKNEQLIANCPSQYSGDMQYDFDVPVLFFVNDGNKGNFSLDLKNPGKIKQKITHTIPDWDTDIEAEWNFEIITLTYFDFKVVLDPHITNITQGDTATPKVTVKLIEGDVENVKLTVTQWPVLSALITNTVVTPTETTTLTIETSCDTPPDSYLFTVRGEVEGKFQTSQDAVTLYVNPGPTCSNT